MIERNSRRNVLLVVLLGVAILLTQGCAALRGTGKSELPGASWTAVDTCARELLALEDNGATVAVDVRAMDGSPLWRHDPDRLMVSASVYKLITAAYAMTELDEDFRWETRLYGTGPVDTAGVLQGDLVIEGGWDPTLTGNRPYPAWPWKHLKAWAELMHAMGLNRIAGNIVAAGSIIVPDGWEVDDLSARYAPVISQLTWNDGCVGVILHEETREVALLRPAHAFWSLDHSDYRLYDENQMYDELYGEYEFAEDLPTSWEHNPEPGVLHPSPDPRHLTADALRQALYLTGVEGGDSVVATLDAPERWKGETIGLLHRSQPLDSVLQGMLKSSNNLWAELIWTSVGPARKPWLDQTQTQEMLRPMGMKINGARGFDASGLSRHNNLKPVTVTELLIHADTTWGERWHVMLPEPGETNTTLEKRMIGSFGRVRAKTGGMSRLSSLAGYVYDKQGEPALTFCIFLNNDPNGAASRDVIDRFIADLVTLLDRGALSSGGR